MHSGRAMWPWAIAILFLGAFNAVALRVWPAYQTLLTRSPVVGSTIEALGGEGISVSVAGGRSRSAPTEAVPNRQHPVVVIGGFADALRTVVVIKVRSGLQPFAIGADAPTITNGSSIARLTRLAVFPGEQALVFPAPRKHAPPSLSNIVVVLKIPDLIGLPSPRGGTTNVPGYGAKGSFPSPFVRGAWSFEVRVRETGGAIRSVPGSQVVGGTTYRMITAKSTGPFLALTWQVTGAAVAVAISDPTSRQASVLFADFRVYAPGGALEPFIDGGVLGRGGGSSVELEALFVTSQPGTYRFVVGTRPSVIFEIPIFRAP